MTFTDKSDLYDVVAHFYLIVKEKLTVYNNFSRLLKEAKKSKDKEAQELYSPFLVSIERELLDIDNILISLNVPLTITYEKKKESFFTFTIKHNNIVIGTWKNTSKTVWEQIEGEPVMNYIKVRDSELKSPYNNMLCKKESN